MAATSGSGTGTATVARWSRAFVAAGVALFVAWHVAALAGVPRAATVVLGLQGFVLHVVFGKAYQLVPSYFARELAVPRAPTVHLPLALLGTLGLFVSEAGLESVPLGVAYRVGLAGAVCWLLGCLVFVGSLAWTVRGNPMGAETGTGDVDRHRECIDRAANAAIPIVLGYLFVGSMLPVLESVGLVPAISRPATTHLLAAGTGALLVFAIGFRLLPRLLVVSPRPALVALVLPAGAVGPALLAVDFRGGWPFRIGAVLQALALVGFAVAYADIFRRSERRRVGGWTILAAASFGVGVALLGLSFAADVIAAAPAFEIHYRLAIGGFLGLTIVGVSYHFYPPGIASSRLVDERTAALAVVALVGGLVLEATGSLAATSVVVTGGRALAVLGALIYAVVLGTVFLERPV